MTATCSACGRVYLPILPGTRYLPTAHVTYDRSGRSSTPIPCVPWAARISDQQERWRDDSYWDLDGEPAQGYVWPE